MPEPDAGEAVEPVGDDPELGGGEEHEVMLAGDSETTEPVEPEPPPEPTEPTGGGLLGPTGQIDQVSPISEPTGGGLLDLETVAAVAALFETDGEGVQHSAAAIASRLGRRAVAVRKALNALVAAGELTVAGTTSDRRYTKTSSGTRAYLDVHTRGGGTG